MTVNPILVLILSFFIINESITFKKGIQDLTGAYRERILITQGKQIEFSSDSQLGNLLVFINGFWLWFIFSNCKTINEKVSSNYSYVLCFWIWFIVYFIFWIRRFIICKLERNTYKYLL